MKEKDNIFGTMLFLAQRWTVNGDLILKQKTGITVKQWMLLIILLNNFKDQHPTISETAKVFGTSRQNLKQVALALRKKELITIRPDENDFRIQRIALTGKHESLFEGEDNIKWQQDYINSLFEELTNDEIIQLNTLVNKLVSNL